MVRRGRTWEALIARRVSTTRAALQPLSRAPVPSSQESRCAPTMTNSSGFSAPRSSAITLAALMGPPIWFGMLVGPHQIFDGEQARHAFAIFPGNDHHGQLVNFT